MLKCIYYQVKKYVKHYTEIKGITSCFQIVPSRKFQGKPIENYKVKLISVSQLFTADLKKIADSNCTKEYVLNEKRNRVTATPTNLALSVQPHTANIWPTLLFPRHLS